VSDLERWRKGPAPRGSGQSVAKYLDQVAEISGLGLADLGIEALVPPRRLAELARYGMTASASLIRRYPEVRRLATLLATVRHLEAKSVDDALEMLDLLMSAELVGRARTTSDKDKAHRHPRLARASARLAVAVEALFDSDGWGSEGEEPRVSQVWEAIEAVVSRSDLRAALEVVTESTPPPDAEDPDWRAALVGRYQAVAPVLKVLPGVITFGASAEGAAVLAAMRALPDVLAYRGRLKAPLVPGTLIDPGVVTGPWKRLVFGHPDGLLAGHAGALDAAYRKVAGRLAVNTEVTVDDAGKIHLTGVKAVEEPPSLVDLRRRTTAMLPRVDLPEVILEVMSWAPELAAAFTAASGGRSRLEDLPVSVAACLAAHSMNVGYRPIAKKGVPALERSRLSHVFQNYVRPETLVAANAPLVARQAGLPLAQAWGGGLVAGSTGCGSSSRSPPRSPGPIESSSGQRGA
jgi:hypothetical protein